MVASPKRAEGPLLFKDTDAERVLSLLRARPGQFVADLYRQSHAMVHSRIAELRRKGHVIECKCFGRGDYRYRLVK